MGALSVTPNAKYQAPFAPLIPGVKVGKMNVSEGLEELIDERTCGVIVEPIQGEGGIFEAEMEWLGKVVKRAREVGAVVIFDEIQVSSKRMPFLDSGLTILFFVFSVWFVPNRNDVGSLEIPSRVPVRLSLSVLSRSAKG